MGIAILAVVWIVGLYLYFRFTTERQRENWLLIFWILLLAPAVIYPISRWLGF